jgi:hypothetical protein
MFWPGHTREPQLLGRESPFREKETPYTHRDNIHDQPRQGIFVVVL